MAGVVSRESVATLRSALWPLARLHPMATPGTSELRPVLMVHGFLGHPEVFRPLRRRLYLEGWRHVEAVGYPSSRLRLAEIVQRIDAAARPLVEAHGPIDVVGHSLGAVSTRAWLREFGGADKVRRFVSLGGPHAGTLLHRLAPETLGPVLDPAGYWVELLAEGPEPVDTVVIRARYDQQVFPPERARLPGVREVVLEGHGHNGLLWSTAAHDAVVEALRAP